MAQLFKRTRADARDIMIVQVVAVKPGARVPEVAAVDERFRVGAGAGKQTSSHSA